MGLISLRGTSELIMKTAVGYGGKSRINRDLHDREWPQLSDPLQQAEPLTNMDPLKVESKPGSESTPLTNMVSAE